MLSAAVAVSCLVLAMEVARNGFANPTPTSVAALALAVWVVALTLVSRQGGEAGRRACRSDGPAPRGSDARSRGGAAPLANLAQVKCSMHVTSRSCTNERDRYPSSPRRLE